MFHIVRFSRSATVVLFTVAACFPLSDPVIAEHPAVSGGDPSYADAPRTINPMAVFSVTQTPVHRILGPRRSRGAVAPSEGAAKPATGHPGHVASAATAAVRTHEFGSLHRHFEQRFRPRRASLPDARYRVLEKTPYSYGYFGASGKAHWTKQYGYREKYTQWTLR